MSFSWLQSDWLFALPGFSQEYELLCISDQLYRILFFEQLELLWAELPTLTITDWLENVNFFFIQLVCVLTA